MLDTSLPPPNVLCLPTVSRYQMSAHKAPPMDVNGVQSPSSDNEPLTGSTSTATSATEMQSALDCIIKDLKDSFAAKDAADGYSSPGEPLIDDVKPTLFLDTDHRDNVDSAVTAVAPISLYNGSNVVDSFPYGSNVEPSPSVDHLIHHSQDASTSASSDVPFDGSVGMFQVTDDEMPIFSPADIKSLLKEDTVFPEFDQQHMNSVDNRSSYCCNSSVDQFAVTPTVPKINFVNMAGRAPMPDMTKIMGYDFTIHPVDGLSEAHVCVTDVFRTFFSSHHWDEFKDILKRNQVKSLSTMGKSCRGVPEVFDVVSVKEVERLLLNNQARKDGFVRCTSLDCDADKVIMTSETQTGELSSGIRTRHSDRSDINYVEIEGVAIPSILVNGVQSVRAVDLLTMVLVPRQLHLTVKHLCLFKTVCAGLGVPIDKCSHNQKSRLVVCAKSYRSSSLHVVPVDCVPVLTSHYKEMAQKKAERMDAAGKGQHPTDVDQTVPVNTSSMVNMPCTSSLGHSLSTDNAVATCAATLSGQTTARGVGGRRPRKVDTPSLVGRCIPEPQLRSVQMSGTTLPRRGRKRKSFTGANSALASKRSLPNSRLHLWDTLGEQKSPKQSVPSTFAQPKPISPMVTVQVDLRHDFTLGCDLTRTRAKWAPFAGTDYRFYVDCQRERPLPVFVYNRRGYLGPGGLYMGDLFVSRDAPCIWCTSCNKMFSVVAFTYHVHGSRTPVCRAFLMVTPESRMDKALMNQWLKFRAQVEQYRLEVFGEANTAVAADRDESPKLLPSITKRRERHWSSSSSSARVNDKADGSTTVGESRAVVTKRSIHEMGRLLNKATNGIVPPFYVEKLAEATPNMEASLINQYHVNWQKRPFLEQIGLKCKLREGQLHTWVCT
uniref:C-SKI SMAD4-binding domain-containing protein n=1 Tax=Trichuris muris TaxID=70415 RepID=A0A5S6QS21_TRIMR